MPAPYDDGQPALWVNLISLTAQWVNIPPTGIFVSGPPPVPVTPPPPPSTHGSAWNNSDLWVNSDTWIN